MQVNEHDINPKEIVLEFLEALNRSTPPIFVSAWYQVHDGKISSMKLVFDPRPFLQQQK